MSGTKRTAEQRMQMSVSGLERVRKHRAAMALLELERDNDDKEAGLRLLTPAQWIAEINAVKHAAKEKSL